MSSARGGTELYPPRWLPAPIRWHGTRVSWGQSWKLAAALVPRWRDRTVVHYIASELPGQDDVLVARLPMLKYLVVRSPELARHILVSHQDNYAKSAEYDMMAVTFGQGLVTDMDDRRYQRNQRLVRPIFSRGSIDQFAGPMTEAARESADRIRSATADGSPVDVGAEMNRLMLDVVARTMFGTDLSSPISTINLTNLLKFFGVGFATGVSRPLRRLSTWVVEHTEEPDKRAGSRVPIRAMRVLTWISAPHIMFELRGIEKAVDSLIADHRSGRIARKDNLLGLLMAARDPETGHAYSDLEIHDELMTFLGAGMETSATAMTWMWKLLAEHPEARRRLYEELDSVLAGRVPTADDVDKLVWCKAIFLEAMRIYPPVIGLTRVAKQDDVLAGYHVKAGTTVVVSVHGVHYNGRVWERPEEFDPSRYLPENMTADHRNASLAFSAGKRICMAQGFATMEVVLALATIAQRFELDLAVKGPVRRQMSFIGAPEDPLMMRATARG
ncbi:cytochrome P450 [Nocardia jejuensis]|uniref:cytochrome P450 n=1 Tax=Nocardia jejuensis TaxID=328049 RepID=UPI00083298E2|nr:cytochrome P450 [Nocardia jejuensis]